MQTGDNYSAYVQPLIFFFGAILFLIAALFFAWLLRPNNPTKAKRSTYECGELPIGAAWYQHPIQFYLFALLFVVFDVEAIFLFPWAVQAQKFILRSPAWAIFAIVEMAFFVLVLVIGWFYALKKGALEWME